MRFELARRRLAHADDELGVDAVAAEPVLGSKGLDQAVGAPWQAVTSARNGKGDALHQLGAVSIKDLGW